MDRKQREAEKLEIAKQWSVVRRENGLILPSLQQFLDTNNIDVNIDVNLLMEEEELIPNVQPNENQNIRPDNSLDNRAVDVADPGTIVADPGTIVADPGTTVAVANASATLPGPAAVTLDSPIMQNNGFGPEDQATLRQEAQAEFDPPPVRNPEGVRRMADVLNVDPPNDNQPAHRPPSPSDSINFDRPVS